MLIAAPIYSMLSFGVFSQILITCGLQEESTSPVIFPQLPHVVTAYGRGAGSGDNIYAILNTHSCGVSPIEGFRFSVNVRVRLRVSQIYLRYV